MDSKKWVSLGIRIAVILGIVLLIGAKPELWASVGILGTSIVEVNPWGETRS